MSPRSEKQRLKDILESIEKIGVAEVALAEAEAAAELEVVQMAFDSILYNLVVIGEAVNALSSELREAHTGIPWGDIVGMRNILAHQYFLVSVKVVKKTIDSPLRALARVCQSELRSLK